MRFRNSADSPANLCLKKSNPSGVWSRESKGVGERERIPELDGLRGIAIGTVLFFHYFFFIAAVPPGSVLSYLMVGGRMGWSGVDLFFVLSGFLIGGILLDARDSSNFFCVFYLRRFFRIIPAYLLLLTAYLLLNTLVTGHSTRTLALVTQNGLPIGPYRKAVLRYECEGARGMASHKSVEEEIGSQKE